LQIFQKNKLAQPVACEEVQAYLDEDLEFFGALEHKVEKELPVKMKKNSRLISLHWKKNMRNQNLFS
jgi:hypothetical protein